MGGLGWLGAVDMVTMCYTNKDRAVKKKVTWCFCCPLVARGRICWMRWFAVFTLAACGPSEDEVSACRAVAAMVCEEACGCTYGPTCDFYDYNGGVVSYGESACVDDVAGAYGCDDDPRDCTSRDAEAAYCGGDPASNGGLRISDRCFPG